MLGAGLALGLRAGTARLQYGPRSLLVYLLGVGFMPCTSAALPPPPSTYLVLERSGLHHLNW